MFVHTVRISKLGTTNPKTINISIGPLIHSHPQKKNLSPQKFTRKINQKFKTNRALINDPTRKKLGHKKYKKVRGGNNL